jgi:hypothetical protein
MALRSQGPFREAQSGRKPRAFSVFATIDIPRVRGACERVRLLRDSTVLTFSAPSAQARSFDSSGNACENAEMCVFGVFGLLNYLAQAGVPPQLEVDVEFDTEAARPGGAGDRWNNWIFSLRGSASFDGEESSREMNLGSEISADRITPDWKLTFGAEIDHRREEFDLDEDDPVTVERREREVRWLAVKGLGEHWSIGVDGEVESSTFENTKLSLEAAPAIEYNVFPYSMYTRRQLRALYAIGVRRMSYYEETLFGRTEETRPRHALSLTFEQREQWGSLESRAEWSQYLHDLERTRLEVDSEVSVRILRGLSVSAAVNASRIRDQLSLPRRGATPEEILLRIRQLASGYEYNARLNLTYTFGSIFSAVVNPRFGR